jgi:hypothetical protein
MSHAGFDLLLGERVRFVLVAATLAACSGDADVTPPSGSADAAPDLDSPVALDVQGATMDVSSRPDRIDHPVDASQSNTVDVDAGAGDVAPDSTELALCLRLMDSQDKLKVLTLSKSVDDQYLLLIQDDCRVFKALYPPGGAPALATWRNLLYAYNQDLWGCSDKPPSGFALVSPAISGISPADTTLLIELYLKAATEVLALSSREIADLRRDLQRLAGPLLADGSTSFTLSSCPMEAGVEADAPSTPDVASFDAVASSDASDASTADAEASARDASSDDADSTTDGASGIEEGGD